ncbi:MAG: Uma2 family endonuclease [Kofleriaceae bacterium]
MAHGHQAPQVCETAWVCEVQCPSTRRLDLVTKMSCYVRLGVAYARLIDLEARAVIAHRLEAGRWVTLGMYTNETAEL